MTTISRSLAVGVLAPVLALTGLALAGCAGSNSGGGGSSASNADTSADGASPARAVNEAEPAAGDASALKAAPDAPDASGAGDAADAGDALPAGAKVVRTASQTVRVDDVRAAAARARTTAVALGGYVASENIALSPGAAESATSSLTLRVPQERSDTALDRLAGIGTELSRSTTADDVTATVADLDSRRKTQQASVARVRDLLGRAKSLKDVVLLEGELSRREGDLEAAQARYKALDDQATMSTIDLSLVTKKAASAKQKHDGFGAGLANGWHALGRSTVVVLTALGALLPFLVLLAVLGVPAFLVWRRRRPSDAPHPAQSAQSAQSAPAGPVQP